MIKILFFVFFYFLILTSKTFAVYDPTTRPNNPFGIHILFTSEIPKAAELINSNGGEWGYVTIPIQIYDRDLEKWQNFMNEARKYKVSPIIRLATEPDSKNTSVWRKPAPTDILDFANFLSSLNWPTKNRYVLLFNEVNRFDEWGGERPNPAEYTDLVVYAQSVFKERSQDFFLITAGMDNASPNDGVKYLDNFVFLQRMGNHNPSVFEKIDGISSHSYPNPNFAQPPSLLPESTFTFQYESEIVEGFAKMKKPIFITETGWNGAVLSEETIADYFKSSMLSIWSDSKVVAVTPFLLDSQAPPFDKFSFFKGSDMTSFAKKYKEMPKVKGDPIVEIAREIQIKGARIFSKRFAMVKSTPAPYSSPFLKNYFKVILAMR